MLFVMRHYNATMFKLVTISISVLFFGSANAQRIDTFKLSGTIISALTGKPIPFGNIMKTRTSGTQADSSGKFTINDLPKGQILLSFSGLGYDNADTTIILNHDIRDFKFIVFTNCNGNHQVNKEKALHDIRIGKPKLLLVGSIAPIVYKSDKAFSRKYNVYFYDYGCIPDRRECMLQYNTTIFEYLDAKFGKAWRKEVRKDIIGLNQ